MRIFELNTILAFMMLVASSVMSQTKMGELSITSGMKTVQYNLFPDSNLTYSAIQGENIAYFDTVSRKVNVYTIPSLTLNKSINAPLAIDNKDYLTITKT